MKTRTISLSGPDIGDDERQLVGDVLRGSSLSIGPKVEEFERAFATRCGTRHAVAVSSGTAGLHLAMIASGVSEGDLVVTTPFSFIASANATLYERGIPIFVDVDRETLMPDPVAMIDVVSRLQERRRGWAQLLPRDGAAKARAVRAILPVHVFGRPMDHAELVSFAREHGIAIVDDACEAIGTRIDGKSVGSASDAAVFGFYPNKQMTTGEGGMIVTDRDDWAALARGLRNQGRMDGGVKMRHSRLGYNYRLDEMSAALGIAQLSRLDELLDKRARVAERYAERLAGVEGATPLSRPRPGIESSWFVYVVRLDSDVDRERLIVRLDESGIPSRPYFPPIHLQPLYVERFGYRAGDFPNAEEAGRTLLALPFHLGLSDDDLDYVVERLASEVARTRRGPEAAVGSRSVA